MPKKEDNSNNRSGDKGEKIHSQKHEDAGLESGGKSRGVDKGNENARGFGNAKEVGQGNANERGFGNAKEVGQEISDERGFEKNKETGQGSTDGTGLGNFDGSGSLGNFDGSANLGKPTLAKGCLSSIIGVMIIIAAMIIF